MPAGTSCQETLEAEEKLRGRILEMTEVSMYACASGRWRWREYLRYVTTQNPEGASLFEALSKTIVASSACRNNYAFQ